ncbi:MAG: 50S ribosomal protein L13 [Nanoarchaeota archaeon]
MMKEKIIINAENAVLGRLASFAAKQASSGKRVIVVNCEKVIVLGSEKNILAKYRKKRKTAEGGGSQKGPYFPSQPERMVKRTVRGMLPVKKGRGREIWKSIFCYDLIPPELKDEKMVKSGRGKSGLSLKRISEMLRGGRR